MLRLHRITYPEDHSDYQIAWRWVQEQPELYSEIIGFGSFVQFSHHPVEQIDFALKQDRELIGFASFVLRGHKICEFELITPSRPRVRSVLTLLRELQCQYFDTLGFLALFTEYPDDPKYDRPRRLCRLFGWREPRSNYFEWTLLDQLKTYG